jgi:hypothetical protein
MRRPVLLVVHSANLRQVEIEAAADRAGWSVQRLVSLSEAVERSLQADAVLFDGLGETGDFLADLARHPMAGQHVLWVGFEAPSNSAQVFEVLPPMDWPASLSFALQRLSPPLEDITFSAFDIDAFDVFDEGPSLADPTERPTLPPQVLEAFADSADTFQLEPDEAPEEVPADGPSADPRTPSPLRLDERTVLEAEGEQYSEASKRSGRAGFRRSVTLALLAAIGVGALALSWRLSNGPQVVLPATVGVLPAAQPRLAGVRPTPSAGVRPTPPVDAPKKRAVRPREVLAPVRVEPPKKPIKIAIPFDPGRLQPCLKHLGKRSTTRLRRGGVLVLKMQLGVMRNGRVGSVVTQSARIGRRRAGGKGFLPCVEGAVAGQQLDMRPEVEPTMVLRTFKLRGR